MNILLNALANWKTSILGVLMVIIGIIQASKAPSIQAAFTDPQIQIALLAGVVGFLAKDSNKTGTVSNPRADIAGGPTPEPKV